MPPVVAFLGSIGTAIVGIQTAVFLGPTALAIIGTVAVVGASVLAAKLLAPKVNMGVVDSDRARQSTVRSTIEPRKLVYGETMISGVISFAQVDGANNKNLHQVIAIAGHKLTSIDKIYFDDYSIDLSSQVDVNGDVTSGKFAKKTNEDGVLETMVHIETRDGSSTQTAYQPLVDAFARPILGTGYESTHRGDNVASIYTRWTLHEGSVETWDEVGGIQNIKAVVKGKAVYDPRLDVAAGNTAGANPTTAAYIKYSDGATTATHQRDLQGQNPALMLADYLMDSTFGLGLPAGKIDWPAVVTAADACDFLVPIPVSQTQKRFFGSGVIFGSDSHRKSISKILSGMNGDLIYSQGKYIIKAGIHEASSLDITEDDLAGDFTVKTSIPRADRFNTIKGMFIDPASNYKMTEFAPRTVIGAVARDNGEVLEEEIKLTFTSDRYVAQRIAIKKVNQSFLQTTLSLPVNLKGMKVAVGDRITLALNDFATISSDWNPSKEFKVIGWSFSESGSGAIDLSLIEDDFDRYADPAEGEYNQISNTGVITTSLADVPSPINFTATAGYNSVNLEWTNPTDTGTWEQIWIFASDTTTPPATPIEKFRGTAFTHQIAGGTAKYYWIQAVKYPLGTTPAAGSTNTAKSALVPFGAPTVVTALKIANAVMADDSIDTAQIVTDAVGSAQIAQTLQSSNWSVPNQTGWQISKNGDTTFNNTVVRGNISATTGTVGGFTIGSTNLIAGDGTTRVSLSTADGISLGDNTFADAPFSVTPAGALTATDATITGSISATTGAIGGFDIGTDYIADAADSMGLSSTVTVGDDVRFWAGDTFANRATAPFRVTESGVFTATSATITGAITATSGSIGNSVTVGGTAASTVASEAAAGNQAADQISLLPRADDSEWTVGTGAKGIWNVNGDTSENAVVVENGPHGELERIWKATSTDASGADGGFQNTSGANQFPIASDTTYRFSVFIKQDNTNGTIYLGAYNFGGGSTLSLYRYDGTGADANKYWLGTDLPTQGEWYLLVGFINPSNTNSNSEKGGIYNLATGVKVTAFDDFRFSGDGSETDATTFSVRTYNYYAAASPTSIVRWAHPRVDRLDRRAPSIAELLRGWTSLAEPINAGVTITGGGITMDSGGAIKGGQSAYNTDTGFFLGYDTDAYKFSIGNAGNNSLAFDGTNLAITGAITATSLSLSGITIPKTDLATGVQTSLGSADSAIQDADTSVNLGLNAGSVGGITINSTSLTSGSHTTFASTAQGFFLGSDGSMSFADGTNQTLTIDTSGNLAVTGTVNASAGAFTGDVSTDAKFIAGSNSSTVTLDGNATANYSIFAGAEQATDASFRVASDGVVEATRFIIRDDANGQVLIDTSNTANPFSGIVYTSISQGSGAGVDTVAGDLDNDADEITITTTQAETFLITTKVAIDDNNSELNNIGGASTSSAADAISQLTATQLRVEYYLKEGSGSYAEEDVETISFTTGIPSSSQIKVLGLDRGAGYGGSLTRYHAIVLGGGAAELATYYNTAAGANRARTYAVTTASISISQAGTHKIKVLAKLVLSGTSTVISTATTPPLSNNQSIGVVLDPDQSPLNQSSLEDFRRLYEMTSANGFVASQTVDTFAIGEGTTILTSGGTISGDLVITGNLTVDGTTTSVHVADLTVADKDITLNYSTGDSSSTANNAGIIIQDAVNSTTDASILWKTASDTFEFSHGANIPKTYLKATDQDAESGTWTSSTTGGSWGTIKFAAGYSYTYNAGAYKQYNIPAGADTCYMSFLKWSDGGYVDVHAIQADGDLVFLGRISTGQSVENINEGDPIEHDGQAIVKIGTGLSSFSSIRITNKRGAFYFSGLAFSTQELDNFDSGMIAAETIHSGVLSNVTNLGWDAAYAYSLIGHLPLAGGTLTGAVLWPSGSSTNANTAYTYSQVGHLPLTGGTLSGNLNIVKGTDALISLQSTLNANDPVLRLEDGSGIATAGFEIWYDNSVGDTHFNSTYDNDAGAIRFHTRTGAAKSSSNERFTISADGLVNIVSGSLAMGGISVIDSNQNINAASISTDEITSAGDITLTSTTTSSPSVNFNSSTATDPAVDMAIKLVGEELHFYEPEDTSKVHFKIYDDTGVDAPFGYWVNGTRMADANRNLTVGTISSGIITATGGTSTNWNTAYTYSQVGHLPLAGGTLTGVLTVNSTNDNQILLTSPSSWTGIGFNDSAAMANDYIWHNGTHGTFAIGGGGANVANKKLHVDGGMTIGSGYDSTAVPANSLNVEGTISSGDITTTGIFTANGIIDNTLDNTVQINSDDHSALLLRTASNANVFSVMPWTSGNIYLSAGGHYNATGWKVTSNASTPYLSLFNMSGSGASFYFSTDVVNGYTGAWNIASNRTLWNEYGRWDGDIDTSFGITLNGDIDTTAFDLDSAQGQLNIGKAGDRFPLLEDEDTGYTNTSIGGLGFLSRNAYDSYITSNAYYYRTGGASSWRSKYSGRHVGILELTDGKLVWKTSNSASTAANESASLNTRFQIDSDGGGLFNSSTAINGNGSYVGNAGYHTLTLQDTNGYAGISFKDGDKNWLLRKNGGNDDFEFSYSGNASAQGVGTFASVLTLRDTGNIIVHTGNVEIQQVVLSHNTSSAWRGLSVTNTGDANECAVDGLSSDGTQQFVVYGGDQAQGFLHPNTYSWRLKIPLTGAILRDTYTMFDAGNYVSSVTLTGDTTGSMPLSTNTGALSVTTATTSLTRLGAYIWDASDEPNETSGTTGYIWHEGITTAFVRSDDGYPSFGSVVRIKTYANDGGAGELYFPYGANYGGNHIKFRLGLYDNAGRTAYRDIVDTSTHHQSKDGGFSADVFSYQGDTQYYLDLDPAASTHLRIADATFDLRGTDNAATDNGKIYLGAYNGPANNAGTVEGPAIIWKPNLTGYAKESVKIAYIAENNYLDGGLSFQTNGGQTTTSNIVERFRIRNDNISYFTTSLGIKKTNPNNSAWGTLTNVASIFVSGTNYGILNLEGSGSTLYTMGVGGGRFYMAYEAGGGHMITVKSGSVGVGSGNTSPNAAYSLDVDGDVLVDGDLVLTSSDTSFNAITIGSSAQTVYSNQIWYSNAGTFQIWKSGTLDSGWGGASNTQIYSSVGSIHFHPAATANQFVIQSDYVRTNKGLRAESSVGGSYGPMFSANGKLAQASVGHTSSGSGEGIFFHTASSYSIADRNINGSGSSWSSNTYRQLTLDWPTGIRIQTSDEGTYAYSYLDVDAAIYADEGIHAPIYYDQSGTSYYLDLASTGDSLRVAGNIVAYYSDERLKDIEKPIPDALEKVKSLTGFYYRPNEKAQSFGYKNKREVGVSAQAVERILPEVVTDAAIDPEYKTVDYARLVPLLIEAIKDLSEELQTLKKDIKESK